MRADLQGQRQARRLRVRVGPPRRRVQAHGPVAPRHGRAGERSRGREPLDAGEGVARRPSRAAQSRKHVLRQRRDPVRVRHPIVPRRSLGSGPRGRPERRGGCRHSRRCLRRRRHCLRGRSLCRRVPRRRLCLRARRASAVSPEKKRRRKQQRNRRAPFALRVDGRRRPRRRRPAAVRGRAVPGDRRAAGRTGVPEAAAGVSGQGRRAGALRLRREGRTRTRTRRRRGAPGTKKRPRDAENNAKRRAHVHRRSLPRSVHVRHDVLAMRVRVRGVLARGGLLRAGAERERSDKSVFRYGRTRVFTRRLEKNRNLWFARRAWLVSRRRAPGGR
mmetsp:Transcript_2671/g.10591  ORF Transcript_2671/g.10591 Transcript_2671/m.10591 type:complete len:331 (-) Transcript_2671:1008-2000(-)